MYEPDRQREQAADTLALTAFLYASGELDAAEAEAFEQRLGEDQAARAAVAQAVQLSLTAAGPTPPKPDPIYRQRVRQRLRPQSGLWRRLTGRRAYRGHPLAWSALGAAAAVLLLFGFFRGAPAPAPAGVPPVPEPAPAVVATEAPDSTSATAEAWARVKDNNSLWKAHAQLGPRPDDRRPRPAPRPGM